MSLKNWIIQQVIEREAKKMGDKLQGKKTFIVMGVVILLGAIDAYNAHCVQTLTCTAYAVPGWVYSVLGAAGIWTRSVAKPS